MHGGNGKVFTKPNVHASGSLFHRVGNFVSAILSGFIVLSILSTVLSLQFVAVRDTEEALDKTSSSIRTKTVEVISLELASLVCLVFADAMKLDAMFAVSSHTRKLIQRESHRACASQVRPPTRTDFTDDVDYNSFIQDLFPFVTNDGRIDRISPGGNKYFQDYIGVVRQQ